MCLCWGPLALSTTPAPWLWILPVSSAHVLPVPDDLLPLPASLTYVHFCSSPAQVVRMERYSSQYGVHSISTIHTRMMAINKKKWSPRSHILIVIHSHTHTIKQRLYLLAYEFCTRYVKALLVWGKGRLPLRSPHKLPSLETWSNEIQCSSVK